MDRLEIRFLGEATDGESLDGLLEFPGLSERFSSSMSFWTKNQYEEQWKSAILRLRNGHPVTCLVTSVEDPRNANFFRTWVLYRISDSDVAAQERILFSEQLPGRFDPSRAWDFAGVRRDIDEDGNRVSEWIFPFASV